MNRIITPMRAALVFAALLLAACADQGPTSPLLSPAERGPDVTPTADDVTLMNLIVGGIEDVPEAKAVSWVSKQSAQAAGFEPIDVPGALATRTFGINAAGQIIGSYTDAAGTYGFLWDNGNITKIEFPGANETHPWGINAQGDIVGRYTKPGEGRIRGFLLSGGTFTDISIADRLHTMPTGISPSGEIVGCFHGTDFLSDMRGFLRRGDEVTSFELLPSTMHNGVTPGGKMIAGLSYESPAVVRAYVIDRGEYKEFNAPTGLHENPDAPFTQAWDVNPSGTVVGYFNQFASRGFSRDGDTFTIIDVPNARWTRIFGINPQGDMVGVYADASGKIHGFLLRGRDKS